MTSVGGRLGMAATTGAPTIEDYFLADDGVVPNNPRLPLIVYRGALETDGDAAARCVALFDRNGWTGAWKNGVYAHHHYHSSAHEVLGVAHKNEGASPDLLVVGAYPRGQTPDMCGPGAVDHARAPARIAAVPLPEGDPVHGPSGPLLERWRAAERG